MKFIYALCISILSISCSIDDILKADEELYIAFIDITDTVKALPGDTVAFKFIASTNFGGISKIEIIEKINEYNDLRDSIRFSMVDAELGLTIDKDGKLSRPVETVIMEYPIAVPKTADVVGKVLGMKFRVTSSTGTYKDATYGFKIINNKVQTGETAWKWFQDTYKAYWWPSLYSFEDHETFRVMNLNPGDTSTLKKINVVAYCDSENNLWCMSPGHQETIDAICEDYEWFKDDNDVSKLTESKFILLSPELELDKLNDQFLESMDFSNASHKIKIGPLSVIGVMDSKGKRGAIKIEQDPWDGGSTDYYIMQSIVQIQPKPAIQP